MSAKRECPWCGYPVWLEGDDEYVCGHCGWKSGELTRVALIAADIMDGRREVLADDECLAVIITPRRRNAARGVAADVVRYTDAAWAGIPPQTMGDLIEFAQTCTATARRRST